MKYSKRMHTFSQDKSFIGNEGELHFELTLQKELPVNFYATLSRNGVSKINYQLSEQDLSDPRSAIFFGISKLLHNSNLDRIKSFTARELDSFLRDENHIECMESFPTLFISEFINRLIAELFYYEISEEIEGWNISRESGYVQKIAALGDFFAIKLNTHQVISSENYEIHLVHLTDEQVFIELRGVSNGLKMDHSLLTKDIFSKLEIVVRRIIDSETIKLVAE